jgi:hypothetical protein
MYKVCLESDECSLMKSEYSAAIPLIEHSRQQRIKTIRLWINAFIPREIPDTTRILDHGEHAGKTILPVPMPTILGYLTDQRDFSTDPMASSRMHSELAIDVATGRILQEVHRCDPTTEIGNKDGIVSCEECADTSDMKFSLLNVNNDSRTLTVNINASARNACLKLANRAVSPRLDISGTISIRLSEMYDTALVWFNGLIEPYPAFEMYACANGKQPETVFKVGLTPHATILDLVGAPGREIYGEAELAG